MTTAAALIGTIETTLEDVLARWIPPGSSVALLDIPTHTNVGDHAIMLGEFAHLRRADNSLAYVCALDDYSPDRLRDHLEDGLILIHGGGNLGDLWPHHQRFRERVLGDFPRSCVVQLPQSIKFGNDENLERARRAFGSHPDFTLLVRDREALSFATEQFDCRVDLCPDAAFALGPLARRRNADTDVLILARTDHETGSVIELQASREVEIVDWVGDTSRSFRLLRGGARKIALNARRTRLGFSLASPAVRSMWEALARERLDFGLTLLSRGRAVVTDRLHGHILCTLLGIPHVIRDAGYGKVTGFHATWTRDSPITTVCETHDEALAVARKLAAAWVNASRDVSARISAPP